MADEEHDWETWVPERDDEQNLRDLLEYIAGNPLCTKFMLIRVLEPWCSPYSYWTPSNKGGLLQPDEEIAATADVEWEGQTGGYYRTIQVLGDGLDES